MKIFSKLMYWILGWKAVGEFPKHIQKCVIISFPHTSMWDSLFGKMGLAILGVKANFFIRKEFFQFPIGLFLRSLGGIPVDRGKGKGAMNTALKCFKRKKRFFLVITPEGTRSYIEIEDWKQGFYTIAVRAGVPIVMAYLDYRTKEGGIIGFINPTGDYQADLEKIKKAYLEKKPMGRYPEKFCLTSLYEEGN